LLRSSPVVDPNGTPLGVTRMVHVTDFDGFHEQDYYAPGDRGLPVHQTRAGRVGVVICYDRRVPEAMRAVRDADVVVVPQAGTVGEWPDGLYEAELRVVAFQNGYLVALCNRVGREGVRLFPGESFVCGPDGVVLVRAGTGTAETLTTDLDLTACERSFARRLLLPLRRPDSVS
jgi:N-carbamoylputrescine amidase